MQNRLGWELTKKIRSRPTDHARITLQIQMGTTLKQPKRLDQDILKRVVKEKLTEVVAKEMENVEIEKMMAQKTAQTQECPSIR